MRLQAYLLGIRRQLSVLPSSLPWECYQLPSTPEAQKEEEKTEEAAGPSCVAAFDESVSYPHVW